MVHRTTRPAARPVRRQKVVRRLLGGAFVGAVLSALFSLVVIPRQYASQASIVFPIPAENRLNPLMALTGGSVFGPMEVPFGSALPILTYSALLNSEQVLLQAAADTGLRERYEVPSEERLLRFMRGLTGVEISPERLLTVRVSLPGTPRFASLADVTNWSLAGPRDAEVRRLSAQVAQALLQHMGDAARRLNLDASETGINIMREQRAELEADLEGLRAEQIQVQTRLAAADGPSMAQALTSALAEAEAAQRTADGELQGLERRRTELQEQSSLLRTHLRDLPDGLPLLNQQRLDYVTARAALDAAEQRWGPESSEVLNARQTAEGAWARLEAAAKAASSGLTQELMTVEAGIAQAQGRLAAARQQGEQLRQRASTMPGEVSNLTHLSAQVLQYEARLARTEDQLREAEANHAARGTNWQVLDAPRVPERKSGPSGVRFGLLGLFLGAVLAAAKPAWQAIGAMARDAQAEAEAEEAEGRADVG